MARTNPFPALGLVAMMLVSVIALAAAPSTAESGRGIDHIVTLESISDATPSIGDNITIDFSVQNDGDQNDTAVMYAVEAANGTDVFDLSGGMQPVGQEVGGNGTVTGPVSLWWDSTESGFTPTPDLVYEITITLSSANEDVGNTTNNTATLWVNWSGPELSVSAFDHDLTGLFIFSLLVGDGVNLTWTVSNDGLGDALDFDVALELIEIVGVNVTTNVETWTGLSLAAGDDWTGSYQWNATLPFAGEFITFQLTIDDGTPLILQGTLGDVMILVQERRSYLVYDSFEATPTAPRAEDIVTITVVIFNDDLFASADATDVTVIFTLDGDDVDTQEIGGIPMGETETVWFNWTTTAADVGNHTMMVSAADVSGDSWSDEINIVVGSPRRPMYEVTAIEFSGLTAQDDVGDAQNLTVNVTVKNIGEAAGSPKVSIYTLGEETNPALADATAPAALAPAASWSVELNLSALTAENDTVWEFNVSAGDMYHMAWDTDNTTIPGDVDLAEVHPDSVTVDKTTLELTQGSFTISVKATNHGDALAADVMLDVYVQKSDGTGDRTKVGTTNLGDLVAGAEGTNTTTFTPTAVGSWVFSVDMAGGQLNSSAVTTTPALTGGLTVNVTSGDIKGEVAKGAKKTAKVSVEVKNTGTGTVTDVNVTISDGTTALASDTSIASLAPGESKTVELTVKVKPKKQTLTVAAVGKFRGNDITASAAAGGSATVTNKVTETTPGFEGVVFVAAVVVALAILRRKRK